MVARLRYAARSVRWSTAIHPSLVNPPSAANRRSLAAGSRGTNVPVTFAVPEGEHLAAARADAANRAEGRAVDDSRCCACSDGRAASRVLDDRCCRDDDRGGSAMKLTLLASTILLLAIGQGRCRGPAEVDH